MPDSQDFERSSDDADDLLLLYLYGELDAATRAATDARLARDAGLRARCAALRADLLAIEAALAPAPDGAGAAVAARLQQRIVDAVATGGAALGPSRPTPAVIGRARARRRDPARRAAVTALAASVLLAVAGVSFQAGRHSGSPAPVTPPPAGASTTAAQTGAGIDGRADPGATRERVLLSEVQRHLGASERLLVEVAHGGPLAGRRGAGAPLARAGYAGAADDPAVAATGMSEEALADERDWARTLLLANRLYRFAAQRAGQSRISELLGDLEPVLVDLANGAASDSPEQATAVRESIAARDLLFRVRALQSEPRRPLPATREQHGTTREEETT